MTSLTFRESRTFVDWCDSVDSFLIDLARVTTRVSDRVAPGLYAGSMVADRYRLRRRLGQGAHGVVWVAQDAVSGHEVAIKLIRPASPSSSVRVRAEVGALRSLRTPGAVRLLDEGLDGGLVFIVMPLILGGPFPGQPRPTTWRTLEPLAVRLLQTLGAVHSLGIVHRDLKPANVLVSDGQPIVLDFGLSLPRFLSRPDSGDQVMGTPAYLAPEQVERGEVEATADLYAVGAMLFESLSGRLPHQASDVRSLLSAKFQPPPPIRQLVDDIPAHVARAIDWMLATEAEARPRSAAEALECLENRSATAATQEVWPERWGARSDAVVDKHEVAAQFAECGPFSSVTADAVELLFHQGTGRAAEIRARLDDWLSSGVCRWEAGPGSKLILDRFALDGLVADRRLAEARAGGGTNVEIAHRAALELAVEGRLGLAAAILHHALWELPPSSSDAYDGLLSLVVQVALADGEPQAIDRALYELCRVEQKSEHVLHLEALVRAALAVGPWTERALDLASDLPPFEGIEFELWRQSVRVHAARRASPEREVQVLAELAGWAAEHPDPIVRGTYAGWLGRLRYRQGRYDEAADLHRESAAAPLWRAAKAAGLLYAASSLMEAFRLDEAAALAATARECFEACRHSTGRAQATWFERTLAYRRGDTLSPEAAWIDWIAALGMRDFEGLAGVTEAAIAWRSGDTERARVLADRAEAAWGAMGETAGAGLLAAGLSVASSTAQEITADRVDAVARAAMECQTPGIGIQVLALVAGHRTTRDIGAEEALCAQVPRDQWPHRIDVLSVSEARSMLALGTRFAKSSSQIDSAETK